MKYHGDSIAQDGCAKRHSKALRIKVCVGLRRNLGVQDPLFNLVQARWLIIVQYILCQWQLHWQMLSAVCNSMVNATDLCMRTLMMVCTMDFTLAGVGLAFKVSPRPPLVHAILALGMSFFFKIIGFSVCLCKRADTLSFALIARGS